MAQQHLPEEAPEVAGNQDGDADQDSGEEGGEVLLGPIRRRVPCGIPRAPFARNA